MKIVILSNSGFIIYKFRKELVENLIKDNNAVYALYPFDDYINGNDINEKLENIGCINVNTKIDRNSTNPFRELSTLIKYIRLINQIRPNIVITYTVKPNIYGGLVCRLLDVNYITNITGLGNGLKRSKTLSKIVVKMYKVSLKKSKCIFFQNYNNLQFFINNNIINNKYKLVQGSGVNLQHYKYQQYPKTDNEINLLFIGRIMKEKGIEELLKGAKRLKKQYNNLNFHIVGGMEQNYSDILNEYKELNIVKYYGKQEDVRNYIKESHAVILPSYHEGMANVLLETASSGRPILASKISGCIETFDEGVSGMGFEAKDIDSLCDTIVKFINLPLSKKEAMGIAGRKKMEREFDRNIVVKSYMEEIVG